jgi:hypothetical protein
MVLTEGTYSSKGTTKEGKFSYSRECGNLIFTEGKITLSDGRIKEGKFSYIPELGQVCLVEGRVDRSDLSKEIGTFVYDSDLNDMRFANGRLFHPDGQVDTGTFAYIPELRCSKLVDGRTEKGGDWEEGTRSYIPELGGMRLVEGTVSNNRGTRSGTLVYDPSLENGLGGMRFILKLEIPHLQMQNHNKLIGTISEMTNSFGNDNAKSNLNNLLIAWDSLIQTTTNQAYAEKVTQLSEAYRRCKRTLLICVHPDQSGATETAQQHLEQVQNLGPNIQKAITALRISEPNFV